MTGPDRPDRIDEALAAWRAATDAAAPSAALLDRIARATGEAATPSSPSLALAVWRLGRPVLAGLAVTAALLLFAATRSVDRLEDRAAAAIEVLAP